MCITKWNHWKLCAATIIMQRLLSNTKYASFVEGIEVNNPITGTTGFNIVDLRTLTNQKPR